MRIRTYKPQAQSMQIIDAYLEFLRRSSRTQKTIEGRRDILLRLDHDMPFGIGQVSVEELRKWLYRDRWSQNTRATYYHAIKSFYGWAANPKDPWLTADPSADLEPVSRPRGVARPVTDEQLQRILAEAAEPFRTWAIIAAYQGLRCVEISRLDREHVTERNLIVVRGKGDRARVHDTDPAVWAAVKDLPPGPVAVLDGHRATPDQVSVRSALHFQLKLDMPGVSLHRLRHWLGCTVQREYKDIRVTMAVLGHAALSSTEIYTQATDEQQRAARSTLPRFA